MFLLDLLFQVLIFVVTGLLSAPVDAASQALTG